MSKKYIIKLLLFVILCILGSCILVAYFGERGTPWYYSGIMGISCMILTNIIVESKNE